MVAVGSVPVPVMGIVDMITVGNRLVAAAGPVPPWICQSSLE